MTDEMNEKTTYNYSWSDAVAGEDFDESAEDYEQDADCDHYGVECDDVNCNCRCEDCPVEE